MKLTDLSATDQLHALDRKEVSSRELTLAHLDRITAHPEYNTVITLDRHQALEAAKTADDLRASGREGGRLLGLPITLKDALPTEGLRTTCGAQQLTHYVPARDADAVARLRAAGTVILGKTNTPAMCQDIQTSNTLYGTTPNPHDPRRTAGGSSGGPAAAVAAHLSPLDVGSDLAGSLRLPGHYCGVYTLRPSYGLVPTGGHIPPPPGWVTTSDMLTLGPVARTATDLELALEVLAGPSPAEAGAWRVDLPAPRHEQLGEYRIGLRTDDAFCPVDTETHELLQQAARILRSSGATVDEHDCGPVRLQESNKLFETLLFANSSATTSDEAFAAEVAAAGNLDPDDQSPRAVTLRARAIRHRDWRVANEERARLRKQWAEYFRHYDALITPAAPTAAVKDQTGVPISERYITVDGQRRGYFEQTTWLNLASCAYLPAATVPLTRTREGLPLGVQLIGPYLEDRNVTRLAALLARACG